MKIRIIIFIFFFHGIYFGQVTSDTKYIETVANFSVVQDSIAKLLKKPNSIIIKLCDNYTEFYLSKDSLHWNGCFIKSLIRGGVALPTVSYVNDGVTYYSRPNLTSILTFNADSLYKILVQNRIYSIKQLTEIEIENKFNNLQKSKDKNIRYGLPASSHDCNMTIIINNSKQASYRNILINEERLHCILTLKIFYNIQKLLFEQIESNLHK